MATPPKETIHTLPRTPVYHGLQRPTITLTLTRDQSIYTISGQFSDQPPLPARERPFYLRAKHMNLHMQVEYIHVDEDLRRNGIGRCMVKMLLRKTQELGIPRVELNPIPDAEVFWTKMGFEEAGGGTLACCWGRDVV